MTVAFMGYLILLIVIFIIGFALGFLACLFSFEGIREGLYHNKREIKHG